MVLEPLSDDQVRILVENHRQFRDFLGKRLRDPALAEDLLQQAMRKAIENPPNAENDLGVLAWFYQVLRTTLTDHFRAQASESSKNEAFHAEILASGQDHVPAQDELEAAVCACLKGLLPTLKPDYAELIQRIDLSDEPLARVAKDLVVTEGNLRVRLHRARQALKTSLERACGTCTEHGCLDCTCG